MIKYKTYFVDIDGTIIKYRDFEMYKIGEVEAIPSTVKFLREVKAEGHMVILTTARPESYREHTIKELKEIDVSYDRLIMEIERGPRYLINDMDPNQEGERAIAINLVRNEGI